jgi:hypothetical protein
VHKHLHLLAAHMQHLCCVATGFTIEQFQPHTGLKPQHLHMSDGFVI